jgi:hypothetical protein
MELYQIWSNFINSSLLHMVGPHTALKILLWWTSYYKKMIGLEFHQGKLMNVLQTWLRISILDKLLFTILNQTSIKIQTYILFYYFYIYISIIRIQHLCLRAYPREIVCGLQMLIWMGLGLSGSEMVFWLFHRKWTDEKDSQSSCCSWKQFLAYYL